LLLSSATRAGPGDLQTLQVEPFAARRIPQNGYNPKHHKDALTKPYTKQQLCATTLQVLFRKKEKTLAGRHVQKKESKQRFEGDRIRHSNPL